MFNTSGRLHLYETPGDGIGGGGAAHAFVGAVLAT